MFPAGGYAMQKAVTRSPLGGDAITDIVLKYLEKAKGIPVKPRYSFKRRPRGDGESFDVTDVDCPNTSAGYRLFKQREIAADLKETVCRLSDTTYSEEDNQNIPHVSYELPDGNTIDVGVERFKIPELIFQPHLLETLGLGDETPDLKMADGSPLRGLPALILENINKCDVDVRKDLFGGMILAGGGSLFGSLRERLEVGRGEARFESTRPSQQFKIETRSRPLNQAGSLDRRPRFFKPLNLRSDVTRFSNLRGQNESDKPVSKSLLPIKAQTIEATRAPAARRSCTTRHPRTCASR